MATEYISREKMHKANRCEWDGVCGDYDGHQIFIDNENMIDSIPAADAVEVVRCGECINWTGNDCFTIYGLFAPKPNDYCARGERREPNDG